MIEDIVRVAFALGTADRRADIEELLEKVRRCGHRDNGARIALWSWMNADPGRQDFVFGLLGIPRPSRAEASNDNGNG